MPETELERAADVDRVYEELRRAVDRDARDPATMRGLAERFWPVSADKPLERRPGPKGWLAFRVKRVLAELVTVPYKWYPGEKVLTQAFLWRLLDLEEAGGRPIDAVIATKFPSYVARHPRKVVWLLHQFRQAWDLDRTKLGQFSESAEDRALRRKVLAFERVALSEARQIFTTSSIVAGRLRESTALHAEVLAPPPAPLNFSCHAHD